MTPTSDLPPLESGIPIPPPEPPSKRKRSARGLTPWRKHVLSARPGQSVVVGWFDRATVLSACRDYKIVTRTQRVKGDSNAVRIWFLNVASG